MDKIGKKIKKPLYTRKLRIVVIYVLAAISGFAIIFPYAWTLLASFETELDAVTLPPFPLRPVQFTLQNYVSNFNVPILTQAIGDSTIVAISATLMVMTIGVWAAYSLSKIRFRGRNLLYNAIIIVYMIPGLPMLIPIVIFFHELGLMDTLLGLVIAHGIFLVPLMTWFLIGIFDGVPKDLDDAAQIDGLSRFSSLLKVNMPLSKVGLVLVIVFVFTISWNELMFSNTIGLVNTPMLQPVILDYMLGSRVQFSVAAAGAIISSLPIIVLAIVLQRYIISGIMKGAVK